MIELYGRAGCHLCADLAERLTALVGDGWRSVDVDADPELRAEWGDMVPVLLVDGRVIGWGALSDSELDSVRSA